MTDLVLERFWSFVKIDKNTNCWNWVSTKDHDGYSKFWDGIKSRKASRFAYEVNKGTIPSGFTIDHLCRNRECVNPEHLEAVTQKENNLRGDTMSGINARKEYCKNGHLLSEDNLMSWHLDHGMRKCRQCHLEYYREYNKNREQGKEYFI